MRIGEIVRVNSHGAINRNGKIGRVIEYSQYDGATRVQFDGGVDSWYHYSHLDIANPIPLEPHSFGAMLDEFMGKA